MKEQINGVIDVVLNEQVSKFGSSTYFVIKVRGEDGTRYDLVPSSDCNTYRIWKDMAENKMGILLHGFQYLMTKDGKRFLNKRVIPTE